MKKISSGLRMILMTTAAFGLVAMATIAAFSGKNTGQNLSLYSSATMIGRALAPMVSGFAYQGGGYVSV